MIVSPEPYNSFQTFLEELGLSPNSNPPDQVVNFNGTLSMSRGQLTLPGVESHGSDHTAAGPCESRTVAYWDEAAYSIPLNLDDTETGNCDTSQADYQNQTMYHTDWGLQTCSTNSQTILPLNHSDAETWNCDVSQVEVREVVEEPDFMSTSESYATRDFDPAAYPYQISGISEALDPNSHTKIAATTTSADIPYASYSFAPDISYTLSSYNLSNQSHPTSSADETSPFISHEQSPDIQLRGTHSCDYRSSFACQICSPDVSTAVQFAFCPTQHELFMRSDQYAPSISTPFVPSHAPEIPYAIPETVVAPALSHSSIPSSSSSSPSSLSLNTPVDSIPPPMIPSRSSVPATTHLTSKRKHSSLSPSPSSTPNKRARTSRLTIIRPPPNPGPKGGRKLPYGRANVRCREWINKLIPGRKKCILCEREDKKYKMPRKQPKLGRDDRCLEHIVSMHIVQIVKDMHIFDAEALSQAPEHLVKTEAQFAYARREIKHMKCSMCDKETSLVIRDDAIRDHLAKSHKKEESEEELNRLLPLIPKATDWYSYHDMFLYYYPGECPK